MKKKMENSYIAGVSTAVVLGRIDGWANRGHLRGATADHPKNTQLEICGCYREGNFMGYFL